MGEKTTKTEEWSAEYRRLYSKNRQLVNPSETLVRLFKGDYVAEMPKTFDGLRACDISCGSGNNSFFLCDLGLDVYATEVQPDICATIKGAAARTGRQLDVRVGHNQNLPFETDFFDFLISWNVLHYEKSEAGIIAGIAEYARILKPGGRLFLSTTGPEHKILAGAQKIGSHLYRIGRNDDFRRGETFFYFDNENSLRYYFDSAFVDVMIGRIHDHLFKDTLDWWLLTARKAIGSAS